MKVPSWTAAQSKMSVQVNGTYVPFKNVPDSMQRFVRPALFHTGDKVSELQVGGTAFMAKYRRWDFAISTAHQVDTTKGAPAAEKFVVTVEREGRRFAISPNGVHFPNIEQEELKSLGDVVFFDYSNVINDNKPQHFDLTSTHWSESNVFRSDYSSAVIGHLISEDRSIIKSPLC